MGQLWNRPIRTALVASVVLLGGCDSSLKPGFERNIEDWISSVSDAGGTIQATLVQGAPPEAGAGSTGVVSGIGVLITGGNSQQTISSGDNFTHVIVSVAGMTNYYDLTLPGSVPTTGLLLAGATNGTAVSLSVNYAVGDGAQIGPYVQQQLRFLRVGTGDIQISVAWSDTSDVDLHVIDPNGEEISFSHKTSASGGVLDLDGNAACSRNTLADGTNAFVSNENVVWPTGKAFPGQYRVVLDYWSACANAQTDYVVTVQRRNVAPQIFTGTFIGGGEPDDTVTVFTY